MPSIFDFLLGRQQASAGTPPFNPNAPSGAPAQQPMASMLDDTPSARDTLLGLSQGLIAAGAPSPYPTDFGQVFGKAIGGAASAAEGSQDRGLKRAMVQSQVQKANSDIANDKAWQDMFKTPAAAASVSPATAVAVPGAPAGDVGRSGNAISGIESGGRYDAVGPVANAQGNRAYGKYQVLDTNIGPWTQEVLGKPMTPQEFVANPQAQDAVYNAKFGQYVQKYGSPEAASRAWFAGEGGMNNPGAKDVLGTSVQGYGQKFAQAYGPGATGPAPQVAQGDNVPTPLGDGSGNPVQPVQYSPQAGPGPVPQGGPKTLPEVIQTLPPAVRQMMGAMPRKDALPLLMKYADPETHVAIDSATGQVVFAPKNDRSGRYQPVDAMKLDLDRQRLEIDKRAAAAREKVADTGERNALIVPGPDGQPTTNPALPAAKGAVAGAEAGAKVAPALVQHQGELVIKDHQTAQQAAQNARSGMANLDRLGTLLEQVNTNKFQGSTQQLKASAKAMGVDLDAMGIGDNVGVAQAAQALSQQMALQLRDPSAGGGMPGAMSDADRQFLTQMVPSITNDPNANKLMIEWQKKVHQRTIDVGKIINDYVRSPEYLKDPAGVYAKVREYAEKNPLFDPEKDAPKPTMSVAPPGALPPMSAIDAEIERRKGLKK